MDWCIGELVWAIYKPKDQQRVNEEKRKEACRKEEKLDRENAFLSKIFNSSSKWRNAQIYELDILVKTGKVCHENKY